jgi:hypothetical protein
MYINPMFSMVNVPAQFQAQFVQAVHAACNFFDLLFSNPVTLNISFGWAQMSSAFAAENVAQGIYTNYATVETSLAANANSSDAQTAVGTLPANDPTNGGTFFVTDAQAKAWGLSLSSYSYPNLIGNPADPNTPDGTVWLNSTLNWDFT